MFLNFNAYDPKNINHSFNYRTQWIIVDNSLPSVPNFSVSKTSSTVFVASWSSSDYYSSIYTSQNASSGISGIKSYTVTLKNPDGSTKETKSYAATSASYYTFQYLVPNTAYTLNVTATDLAGNSNTANQNATTPPAKPIGLNYSSIGYSETVLSWTASAGATGYDVYEVIGTTYTKINTNSITTNSYQITGLTPNTNHTYYIVAKSSAGTSDISSSVSVQTASLPKINGTETVCSGADLFSLSSLLPNYTVNWSWSNNLNPNFHAT